MGESDRFVAVIDLVDGPRGVFGDERFGVGCGVLKGDEVFRGSDVAEGDAHVPEESSAFDAFDGASLEGDAKGGFVESEVIAETGGIECIASGESGFRAGGGETVPWADGSAVIAAIDTVPDERAEVFGYTPFEFDGEVGDAASGVEVVRRGDGSSGACIDATCAGPTAVFRRGIRLDAEGRDDGGQEEKGTEILGNQHGAFALPTEARAGSEVAFEDGASVDVGALSSTESCETGFEGAESGFEKFVVIEVQGVRSDASGGRCLVVLTVGGCESNDGLGVRQDVSRIGSAFRRTFEPFHLSVATVRDPRFERIGVRGARRFCKTHCCEAMGKGCLNEILFPIRAHQGI